MLGNSYEHKCPQGVQKLSILFIVAEEVSMAILNSPTKKINLEKILEKIAEKYHQNEIVINCIESLKTSIKPS